MDDKGEQSQLNAADQAGAHAASLKWFDLAPRGGWKGGAVERALAPMPRCASNPADFSSFVVTGVSDTDWTRGFDEVATHTEVFQTAKMAAQDWRLAFTPSAIACYRARAAADAAAQGVRLVSFKRTDSGNAFPFLAIVDVRWAPKGTGSTYTFVGAIVCWRKGRTQVWVYATGPKNQELDILADSVMYAKTLLSRTEE